MTDGLFSFLIKVITSWQIIVVTITLIIYFSLVSYVARTHHPSRSGFSINSKPRKEKAPKAAPVEVPSGGEDDDELELEE
ncbi:MAG: hypothetical protein FWG27_01160 [Treponema sp.]|jgi:hypothetical protein|nr:hypothetical protein [Treponema sp.]